MTPGERDRLTRELAEVWETSYGRLLARFEEVVDDPQRRREARNLKDLIRLHEREMGRLAEVSQAWWGDTLPTIMEGGAVSLAADLGREVSWGQTHREAVRRFVERSWDDIARRLQQIDRSTKRALRGWVRDRTRAALMESRTATQAGRELANVAARNGLWQVTYADGAKVPMKHYSDMLLRTVTADAYNEGTLLQAELEDVEWMQYFDSPDCGVTYHEDPVKADGMIVPRSEVVPKSHPNCVRDVRPAPFYIPDDAKIEARPGGGGPGKPAKATRKKRGKRSPRQPRQQR